LRTISQEHSFSNYEDHCRSLLNAALKVPRLGGQTTHFTRTPDESPALQVFVELRGSADTVA
jgi:hypothetical protein